MPTGDMIIGGIMKRIKTELQTEYPAIFYREPVRIGGVPPRECFMYFSKRPLSV